MSPQAMTPQGIEIAVGWLSDMLQPVNADHQLVIRRDSVNALIDGLTARALTVFDTSARRPLEFLSMARLYVRVHRDDEAQRMIDRWLATPNLSRHDQAWALARGVELFVDQHIDENAEPPSARFVRARHYLDQLKARPLLDVALPLYTAHIALMRAYMHVENSADAATEGFAAYAALEHVDDYAARSTALLDDAILVPFAVAVSGTPDGRRMLDSMRGVWHAMLKTSPAERARDPLYKYFDQIQNEQFAQLESMLNIGQQAPPILGTHWLNQSTPAVPSSVAAGARSKSLADGIVRILEFGDWDCHACHHSWDDLQRMQGTLPAGAELLMIEKGLGRWSGVAVEPDVEAHALMHHFVEFKHYTFPIVLWVPPKVTTWEGGRVPIAFPTWDQFGIFARPAFFVVDGHGIIRFRQEGLGAEGEKRLLKVVNMLLHEHSNAATVRTQQGL